MNFDVPCDTRPLTLIECMKRLGADHKLSFNAAASAPALTVHLVGADHREGNTSAQTLAVFELFFRYAALERHVKTLNLVLVGPNIAQKLHHDASSHAWRQNQEPSPMQIELSYFVGSFDDYFEDHERYAPPDLAVCFNAGIWGYDEWLPTLKLLLHTVRTPVLITSYNENEAGDDEDVVESIAVELQWFWRAQKNAFSSTQLRATNNTIGSSLRENDYWMCLGPVDAA